MAEEMQADGTQQKRKGCGWGWVEYLGLLVLIGIFGICILGWVFNSNVNSGSGVFSNINSGFNYPGAMSGVGYFAPASAVLLSGSNDRSGGAMSGFAPASAARLVIKNANLSLEVESVRAVELSIRNLVNQMGGYVIQSSTNGSDEATATANISFRVPADKFEVTLEEVQKLAKKVTSRSISGEDVTAEFADLEAQLKNLEATRSRFQTLLDKAEKSSDALEASKALMNVQGEIEQRLGRKKFLAQSAALSKIDVALSPVPTTPIMPLNAWQPLQVVRGALQGLVKFGQSLINLLLVLLVWLPVWLPLGLLVRWGWPKVKAFRERSNL